MEFLVQASIIVVTVVTVITVLTNFNGFILKMTSKFV